MFCVVLVTFDSWYGDCFILNFAFLMKCVFSGLKGIIDQLPRAHASEFRSEVSKSACIFGHGDVYRNRSGIFLANLEFLITHYSTVCIVKCIEAFSWQSY